MFIFYFHILHFILLFYLFCLFIDSTLSSPYWNIFIPPFIYSIGISKFYLFSIILLVYIDNHVYSWVTNAISVSLSQAATGRLSVGDCKSDLVLIFLALIKVSEVIISRNPCPVLTSLRPLSKKKISMPHLPKKNKTTKKLPITSNLSLSHLSLLMGLFMREWWKINKNMGMGR